MYAEYVYKPMTLGISTTVAVRIIKAPTKVSATQSLGVKSEATATRKRVYKRAPVQNLGIKDEETAGLYSKNPQHRT